MSIAVRIFQEVDAAGAPSPAEFVEHLADEFPKLPQQIAFEFLRRLELVQTGQNGVYRYVDRGRGGGWLRVEGVGPFALDSLERLVEVHVVNMRIGAFDPIPQPEVHGQYSVPRTSNPNIQIGLGVVFAIMGVGVVLLPPLASDPPSVGIAIVIVILGVLMLGAGIGLIVMGARRLSWWRRARADVRARGERMPEHLRILD